MKNNEAMKQAIHDIRLDLAKEGKVFINTSARQLHVLLLSRI